jgi:hypothetical protein
MFLPFHDSKQGNQGVGWELKIEVFAHSQMGCGGKREI